METWIALLRGVNVGGRNKLPMKALLPELRALGFSAIRTYLQSGNVVFQGPGKPAARLEAEIGAAIGAKFGFAPQVFLLSAKDLAAAAAGNPFPESAAAGEGRALHLFFLARAPRAIDRERFDRVRMGGERWQVRGRFLYLHAPDGIGGSKLARQVETILGVAATARNWRTVLALLELATRGG
jgi:uncharacterized protein (DUF1697 family)